MAEQQAGSFVGLAAESSTGSPERRKRRYEGTQHTASDKYAYGAHQEKVADARSTTGQHGS